MGQKVRPTATRIGITRDWSSRWYANKQEYGKLLVEDQKIRRFIKSEFFSAGVPEVEIERDGQTVTISIHAARPGVVIGRKGARVEQLKADLEAMVKNKVQLNINEVPNADLNAQLVGENVADQLRRRMPFRRVLKNTLRTSMDAGAKGIKILVSGRLGGAEIARSEVQVEGSIPLSTLRADIDYGLAEARTTYGVIGVKVWIYRGEVLDKGKARKNVANAKEG
ncbi:MAG: 30S ribosomal protein S3 [Planctomycetota bacterium]